MMKKATLTQINKYKDIEIEKKEMWHFKSIIRIIIGDLGMMKKATLTQSLVNSCYQKVLKNCLSHYWRVCY